MKASAADLWERATDALRVARHDLLLSPDAAAKILQAVAQTNSEVFTGLDKF